MKFLDSKNKADINLNLDKLIPPRKKNWNLKSTAGSYKKEFSKKFIEYYFPYILKNAMDLGVAVDSISMLDLGCGWAPMATPFIIYNKSTGNKSSYLGIDIRKDAIDWLSEAYSEFSNVEFQLHQAQDGIDYIGSEHSKIPTFSNSDGAESKYQFPQNFQSNIQWSSSVFTHLTPEASAEALKSIHAISSKNSIQINTWLIIDPESIYSMSAGIADRRLTFDCGDFLTYSKENPLVCTAYKIEALRKIYLECGFDIVRIDKGSWRGPAYKNSANHYQDIVISRPTQKS